MTLVANAIKTIYLETCMEIRRDPNNAPKIFLIRPDRGVQVPNLCKFAKLLETPPHPKLLPLCFDYLTDNLKIRAILHTTIFHSDKKIRTRRPPFLFGGT